jgi:hypothetical protein
MLTFDKSVKIIRHIFACALLFNFGQLQALSCRAVDGDTLACGKQRIRLANVYAAEINEPGGLDAKQRLSQLVRGQNVTIQSVARDKYSRTVAHVFVNGRPITQSDIGPRAGRGADFTPYARVSKPRAMTNNRAYIAKTRAPRQARTYRAPRQPSQVRPYIKRNGQVVRGHRRKG